eukprot:3788092-Rhodomonas_salina.1
MYPRCDAIGLRWVLGGWFVCRCQACSVYWVLKGYVVELCFGRYATRRRVERWAVELTRAHPVAVTNLAQTYTGLTETQRSWGLVRQGKNTPCGDVFPFGADYVDGSADIVDGGADIVDG